MRTLNLSLTDLHTRDEAADGTLEFDGVAVPYESPITYGGVEERFARSAFDPLEVVGRPILWGHDRSEQIGAITQARNTDEGLVISGAIEDTRRGADVQKLMRRDRLRGLSVGFTPTETDRTPQGLRYVRASLLELSVTPLPAYAEKSTVTAVREEEPTVADTPAPAETREAPTVDLTPITERMDQLEARMLDRNPAPARTLGVLEAFAIQMADTIKHKQLRALGDAVSAGNAGVLPPDWASTVRGYLDGNRWLASRLGTASFPSSGSSITWPAITQEPTVGPRGTELSVIPGAPAFTTDSDVFTAQWLAGGQRIPLELLETSVPEIGSLIASRLLLAYAQESDKYLAATLETAATPQGSVIDFTDYGTVVDSVIDAGEAIRAATGQFGDRLALTTASWKSLLGLTDGDGRRIVSTVGATNADGSAGFSAMSVVIGDCLAFHSVNSSEDMQFNSMSAAFAEKPPMTLTETSVDVMGRSIGVLGAVIALPLYPAGIRVHSAL